MHDSKLFIKLMGILTKGEYSRGVKTAVQIAALTGMQAGDTVFDSTWGIRKIYDGNNWVSGGQISFITDGIPTGGNQTDGAASRVSANNDFRIQSGQSTANDINIIGAVQLASGTLTAGSSFAVVQYSGIGNVASAGNGLINRGTFVELSVTFGRADDNPSPAVGVFGVWLTDGALNTPLKAFIRPIESF
jgi:hypothetical protein